MFWLYFSSVQNELTSILEKDLREWLGTDQLCIRYGREQVETFLKTPHPAITHTLAIIRGEEDLRMLELYRFLTTDWRLILGILPAESPIGNYYLYSFYPRYVAYLPEDDKNIRSVIKKMIEKSNLGDFPWTGYGRFQDRHCGKHNASLCGVTMSSFSMEAIQY